MAKNDLLRAAVRLEDELVIPADAFEAPGFERWLRSAEFPATGRIDFLDGTIEVDMSPEKLQSHGTPKTTLVRFISNIVEAGELGQVFVDRTRLVSLDGVLSCEPDIVFVSMEALKSGRATYRGASPRAAEDFLEVVGAATLVVEIVSNSSVNKDTRRLPPLYAATGVEELWTVDARGAAVQLSVQHLEGGTYRVARADEDGYLSSRVLARRLRMRRESWELPGVYRYFVDERAG